MPLPNRWHYRRKTDQEIQKVALGLRENTVFSSGHLNPDEADEKIGIVFGPLTAMKDDQRQQLAAANITFLFEERAKATKHLPDGTPLFTTMQVLDRVDQLRVAQEMKYPTLIAKGTVAPRQVAPPAPPPKAYVEERPEPRSPPPPLREAHPPNTYTDHGYL